METFQQLYKKIIGTGNLLSCSSDLLLNKVFMSLPYYNIVPLDNANKKCELKN